MASLSSNPGKTALTAATPFEYQPLAEGEFRLIQFLDDNDNNAQRESKRFVIDDNDDDLRCEMKHFDFNNAPSYWALSYTWGTEDGTRALSLNGRKLAIRPNLRAALERIGPRVRNEEGFLWVDAICINQQDVPERNAQVLRMKSIYADARLVAIWLGEHSDNSELAIDSMIQASKRIGFLECHEGGNYTHVGFHEALDLDEKSLAYREILCAVAALCQRPWFTRLWIVQESTSSTEKRFFVGHKSLQWKEFETCRWVSNDEVAFRTYYNLFRRLHSISTARKLNLNLSILNLCHDFRKFKCTDPRDKIYALVGIATDLQSVDFAVDYSISQQEVFVGFVHLQLQNVQKCNQLDFLGCVIRKPILASGAFDRVQDTLPSWVPDWTSRVSFAPFRKKPRPPGRAHGSERSTIEAGKRFYSASKDTLFSGRITTKLEFHVGGFNVDRVLRLSPTVENPLLAPDKPGPFRDWAPLDGNEAYNAVETKQQAFLRTITADIRSQPKDPIPPQGFQSNSEKISRRDQHEVDSSRNLRDFSHASMVEATYLRKFMWTREGRMGLAPAAANVNDKVCLFFGGQVLYILREVTGGKHQFMGECYVHGLMDGEALDPEGRYQQQAEDFVLV